MELVLNMKRSKVTKRLTLTQRFIDLCNYYRETEARYNAAKSRQERKHLLIVLKETVQHARHLASDLQKYLNPRSKLNDKN